MVRPPPPLSDPDLSLLQVEYPSYGGISDGWSALEKVSDKARTLKWEFYFQNLWIITYIKSPVFQEFTYCPASLQVQAVHIE
jgi:hypothetical protein